MKLTKITIGLGYFNFDLTSYYAFDYYYLIFQDVGDKHQLTSKPYNSPLFF